MDERHPMGAQGLGPLVQCPRGHHRCSYSTAMSVRHRRCPASRATRCAGVSGMSAWRTPNGADRVDHGVDDGGRRADGGRLADALRADRVVRRRRDGLAELPVRALHRGRQQVVHERPAEAVAVLVERDQLHQRHADAVGQAAVHLALDDHRVDAHAAVVDRDEPAHLDLAGARVDVDDADVGAVRVGEVRRVVDDLRVEVPLDALGQLERAVRGHRDLLDRLAALGVALDEPAAELPLEVVGRDTRAPRRR